MTRRRALQAAASSPLFLSSSAQGANDRVNMALIGAGGRGRRVTEAFVELGAKCAAVADIYEPNLQKGLGVASPGAQPYSDYRKILERSDIDAVLIGTPDHWHVPMMLDAVQAGKDVYCEKPMSHSISEGNRAIQGVRATDRIVQIGMQRRSTPWIIEAKKMVDDGAIGNITFAKAQWNWSVSKPLDNSALPGKLDWDAFVGPAQDRAMQPMIFRKWRYFWEFSGGNMTDQGTHLMDVIQWFSGSGTPRSASCVGRVVNMTGSEVPDAFAATFEYPNMIATWTLNYNNDYENGWMIRLEGDDGTLVLDGRGYRLYDAPWKNNPNPIKTVQDSLPTIPHVRNFLECIKTREQPNAPVEVGHRAVCGPHLANIAMKTKRMAFLNPEATEIY